MGSLGSSSENSLAASRKEAVLYDRQADFNVAPNPNANDAAPLFSSEAFSEVNRYERQIDQEAKKAGIDPDLAKAIVFIETTQGYYDRPFQPFGLNKSIRPMNINADY